MNTYSRAGFKWTINETLSLQREFELLGLSIDEIAAKHNRSPNAIMHRLDQECFADYNVLYSNYHDLDSQNSVCMKLSEDMDDDDEYLCCNEDDDEEYLDNASEYDDDDEDEQDEIADLSERVNGLEDSIFEIKDMIKKMMNSFTSHNFGFSCSSV
jgi:hypothetical protein